MRIHLETERLVLRDFEPDDVDNLIALDADPAVRRYLAMPVQPSRETYVERIMPPILADTARGDGFGRWAVIEKSTGDFIGWIHFRRSVDTPTEIELGYRLIRSAWGKGYATEGSKALIEKGLREQRVTHISATALADNAASIRVMEKCGLTFEHDYKYGDADAVKYAWRATTDVVSGRRGAAPA